MRVFRGVNAVEVGMGEEIVSDWINFDTLQLNLHTQQ